VTGIDPGERGIVLAGDLVTTDQAMEVMRESLTEEQPYYVDTKRFPSSVMNHAAAQCAIMHGFKGPNSTVTAGRVSGLAVLNYARRLHLARRAKVVLAGAVEDLNPRRSWITWHGHGQRSPAPLGEGCCLFLTETRESAAEHGRQVVAEVLALEFGVAAGPGDVVGALTGSIGRALARAGVTAGEVPAAWLSGLEGDDEHAAVRAALGPGVRTTLPARLIGDTAGAAGALQAAAAIAESASDEQVALVTAVDPDGQVGCGLFREKRVVQLVDATYRTHAAGATVNPPSYFLRFPDRPTSRIIALPASIGGDVLVDGIKWISSFPENVRAGLPRASAVLVLNDHDTGYPFACMESSVISAARTAASSALAASCLGHLRARPRKAGFVGTGLIARYIHTYLTEALGWTFDETGVFDVSAGNAAGFTSYVASTGAGPSRVHADAESVIRQSDLVVFATVAGEPHVREPSWFDHNPLVLHVSLRDLSPEVILSAVNVVDDVEHCLRANTSVHLTEQLTGNRDFLHGTLYDVLSGAVGVPVDRPVIFSPFGLGVLDLAVGKYVYDVVAETGELAVVPGFFAELHRYGPTS
jgi:2,3-diaminopropionate biosynthesis protein SbnB